MRIYTDSAVKNSIVLNLDSGMNPALVGLLGALPRLTDAITEDRAHEVRLQLERRRGTV